jgi:hypothetical protein
MVVELEVVFDKNLSPKLVQRLTELYRDFVLVSDDATSSIVQ